MNKSTISIRQTNAFSDIFVDYIEGKSTLQPFYKYSPELPSFGQAIADKSKENIDRKLLVDVLEKQYEQGNLLSPTSNFEPRTSNLELLKDPKTFTVCTGHQLCLFTGPLYFIYKIISTINLAEELKRKYPSYNFVPLYWMASEDHDFAEINHINLFGKKITWDPEIAVGTKQIPAGQLDTSTLVGLLDELKNILGESENAQTLISLFEKAYKGNRNLANATRYLVNELFGKFGLLVLDPNDSRLKKQFAEIIKDDLLNQTNYKIVNSTIQQFNNSKLHIQVNPREYNFFYIKDGIRKRIVTSKETSINNDSEIELTPLLLADIDAHPENFSPNVVLRPLFQQKILPNLAYVGGPGEIAYWLEYKAMFEHHKINFPVLIPRNFAMSIDIKTKQQWEKFEFKTEDYFRETDALSKEFVLRNSVKQLSLAKEQEQLEKIFSAIAISAEKIDPTLKAAVLAEQQKAINSLKAIEAKLLKAEKQKSETVINQIKKVKEKLFPSGILQERYDNFIPYFIKYGPAFMDTLKKEFDPFENKLIVLTE